MCHLCLKTEISDEETDKTHQNIVSDIPSGSQEDRRLNYGLQVIQLGVMLMQLNDTEKEGDGDRSLIIINWKMLMFYFRCRPRGMKINMPMRQCGLSQMLRHCILKRLLTEFFMVNLSIQEEGTGTIMRITSKWSTAFKTTKSA